MAKQLFKRKVSTLFSRLDADGNGSIEQSDLLTWADRLISLGNIDSERSEALKTKMASVWSEYFAVADVDNSGSISSEEMANYIKTTVADEKKRDLLRTILPLIFDAIDNDKSGSVSKDEFGNYFKSLNINDEGIIDKVFNAMDVNSDGSLSKEEFSEFGRTFFTSGENEPASLFFGPLVD